MKSSGSAARGSETSPPPSSVTGASCVRAVSPQAAHGGRDERGLHLRRRPAGMKLEQQCRGGRHVRRGHGRSVEDREARALVFGRVDERICPPGAARSGLRSCPNAVGPPEEKLVITPLRPVSSSSGSCPIRTVVLPPWAARYARRWSPSRLAIIPPARGSRVGMPFASPCAVVGEDDADRRRPPWPAAPSSSNGQRPRSTSAIAPVSDPAGS